MLSSGEPVNSSLCNRVTQGRGFLSGEAALMRAVYWRLSKAGVIYGNESDAAFDLRTEHQSYDR